MIATTAYARSTCAVYALANSWQRTNTYVTIKTWHNNGEEEARESLRKLAVFTHENSN